MDEKDPTHVLGLAFSLSSVAGLAALLRSSQPLTRRSVLSAFLNSGLFGLGVCFVWYYYYGGAAHPWFMFGISTLAGLGGTSLLDFSIQTGQECLRAYAQRASQQFPVTPSVKPDPKEGS